MDSKDQSARRSLLMGLVLAMIAIGILALMVGPALLTAPPATKLTTIYYADNISPAHQAIIDRFNELHRGRIHVVTVNLPFTKFSTNERKELLARALRGKSDRIDVFTVDVIWVPRFAKWGEPLDAYFPESERNRLLPYALTSCYYRGQLMAVPLYIDVGLMYYRRDLLRALPGGTEFEKRVRKSVTWQEFIDFYQRNWASKDQPFYLFAADNFEGLVCSLVEVMMSGGDSLVQNGRIVVNSPGCQRAVQLLVDLVNRYRMTPRQVLAYDEVRTYMHALSHGALFFRGWPGFLFHQREIIEQVTPIRNFGMAPLPHFSGGRPASVFGGWNLMISKFSRNREAALALVRFMLREKSQKTLFDVSGYIPVLRSIYEDSSFIRSRPDLAFYRTLMQNGVHRPYLDRYTQISDILSYYVNLAIQDSLSAKEALEQAQRAITSNHLLGN